MAIITRKRRRMMFESTPPLPSPPAVTLPDDMMIEILSRVTECNPLELRCVCKWWKSLVLDPQFIRNHLHRSTADINDLASKALDDMNTFESHFDLAPEAVAEEERSLMNELDHMLILVKSLKVSLATIKVDVQELIDRMKCLQIFLHIYLKTLM